MNNEEKILAMLAQIQAEQKQMREDISLLLQKLARKERVEALEDDVALLKTVIKAMSQRIESLEKAGSETA